MGRDHSFVDREFGSVRESDDGATYEAGIVAVLMPFDERMNPVFDAVSRVCRQLGLRAARADHEAIGSGVVLPRIARLIERAEFIVCDLTGGRPNVYYELGYAHGVGNEAEDILLIARTGEQIHFDAGSLMVRFYGSHLDLDDVVRAGLSEMLKATRREW